MFEQGYSAKVEGHSSGSVFQLYHNFNENIGKGSSTTAPTITGFTKDEGHTASAQLYEDEVLLYDVELVVADTANGNVITRFESSKNEKIKGN